MASIIVDAGPLIALFRARDPHHARVTRFLSTNRTRLISTLPVLTEACHFLTANGKTALLAWIRRGGLWLHPITVDDFDEIAEIVTRYAERDIDFADATLIWLAGVSSTSDVMTLDRRDFLVYRTAGNKPFRLVLS